MSRWPVVALLLLACSGESDCDPPAAPACIEIPWSLDWAAGDSLNGCAVPGDPACGLSWCGARQYPQTVFVGCAEPPRPACAWAELSDRPDAWCCW